MLNLAISQVTLASPSVALPSQHKQRRSMFNMLQSFRFPLPLLQHLPFTDKLMQPSGHSQPLPTSPPLSCSPFIAPTPRSCSPSVLQKISRQNDFSTALRSIPLRSVPVFTAPRLSSGLAPHFRERLIEQLLLSVRKLCLSSPALGSPWSPRHLGAELWAAMLLTAGSTPASQH